MAERPHLVAVGEVPEAPASPSLEAAPSKGEPRVFIWLLVAALALCALGWAVSASHQRALEAQLLVAHRERDAARARLGAAREQSHALADEASGLAARLEALDALLAAEPSSSPAP